MNNVHLYGFDVLQHKNAFLGKIQHVAFSPLPISLAWSCIGVCVCVCVYACVCECVRMYVAKRKRFEMIYHHFVGHKKPSNGVFGSVATHDLDLRF